MSTRCQIGIYEADSNISTDVDITTNWQVLLYRHSDGYPDGVVSDVLPFLKEFIKKRGYDIEYMGACLIAYLKHWHCGQKVTDRAYREGHIKVNDFECDPLCHGISKDFHSDIEYFYAITPSNLIVFECSGANEFKEIERYSIK